MPNTIIQNVSTNLSNKQRAVENFSWALKSLENGVFSAEIGDASKENLASALFPKAEKINAIRPQSTINDKTARTTNECSQQLNFAIRDMVASGAFIHSGTEGTKQPIPNEIASAFNSMQSLITQAQKSGTIPRDDHLSTRPTWMDIKFVNSTYADKIVDVGKMSSADMAQRDLDTTSTQLSENEDTRYFERILANQNIKRFVEEFENSIVDYAMERAPLTLKNSDLKFQGATSQADGNSLDERSRPDRNSDGRV